MREAFLVFLSLTVIALFNAGLLWEEQKISRQYMNFELTQMLELNENQMKKIRSIHALYEIEVSKVISEGTASTTEKINLLTHERNKQVMDVLDEEQKKIIRAYCTNLVSFAKIFE